MKEQVPVSYEETPRVREIRGQRKRIYDKANTMEADQKEAVLEKLSEFAREISEKIGRREAIKVGAFNVLSGATGIKAERDDFEGEDSIAAFLDRIEKEL